MRLEPQDGLSLVCDLVRSCRWTFTTARPPPRLSNDTLARIIFGADPSIVNQPNLVQFTTKSSTPLLCILSFGKGSNTKTREVWWVLWWFRRHICLHISDQIFSAGGRSESACPSARGSKEKTWFERTFYEKPLSILKIKYELHLDTQVTDLYGLLLWVLRRRRPIDE